MNAYVLLGLAILSEIAATTALKAAQGFTRPVPTTIVALGYIIAFVALGHVVKTVPIGIAYAVWSGLGIVGTGVLAWRLYGQRLDFAAIAGMGLILAGVLVINLFSKSSGH